MKKSKYFNTAVRMDQAFLELLEKKDMEYITVKELCKTAGVNRSTFYLHYETIGDLLAESVQYMNTKFVEHMKLHAESFVSKIRECPLDELYLVTPTYLMPYLEYIEQNKRLFRAALKNAGSLRLDGTYRRMMGRVSPHSGTVSSPGGGSKIYGDILCERTDGNCIRVVDKRLPRFH